MKPLNNDEMARDASHGTAETQARTLASKLSAHLCRLCIVLGLMLLVVTPLVWAGETPAEGPKQPVAETEAKKMAPEEMEKLCTDFARLHWERTDLEQKKNQLLEQITDAKARLDIEVSPIKRSLTRREIDRLATQWYEMIEKSHEIENQERPLIKNMLQNRDEFRDYLRRTSDSIEKQINALQKTPEQNADRLARLEKKRERVNLVLNLLERLKDRPELFEEIIAAPPEPAPPFEPPPAQGKLPDETPLRLRLRLMRLEKDIQFLRARLDRNERELQSIKHALQMGGEKPNPPQ